MDSCGISEMNLAASNSQLTLAGQLSTGVAGVRYRAVESVQSDVESKISKTSVFDDAASMQLDSIVDSLAADNAAVRMQSDTEDVDDWFASYSYGILVLPKCPSVNASLRTLRVDSCFRASEFNETEPLD